jgi:hypothetical protein
MPAPDDAPSVSSTVIRAVIAAVPYVGGPFEVIVSDWRARQAAKAEQTIADVLAVTGEDQLRARLGSVAEVEAVFVEGVQAAIKTGVEAKRRLLAKAVANAVVDDARIDESWLIADVLSQLDVPHIRALDRLLREWERGPEPGDRAGWSGVWRNLPEPIKATLVRTGTATPTPQSFVLSDTPQFIEGITVYGRELIRQLRDEGYGAENPG